ncbi:putative oxidoreductase yteT [Copromyces sp. CBS 386.78]|nr:putative oxidoreductase yteT [Copromyces sp. CBS 386.78]
MSEASQPVAKGGTGRKRYAIVGTGGRARFFYYAIATDYSSTSCIVRMDYANSRLETPGHGKVLTFLAADFDAMIKSTAPDEVIVTTIDRTHNIYIVRALELGCNDPFALDLETIPALKALYLDAEGEDGYYRDQSVFSDGISIEDTMSLLIRYRNGAVMTYSLTAYAPWEGFRVNFNGTGGRLEVEVVENSYVNAGGDQALEGALEKRTILLRPLFEQPREIEIEESKGAHGGGDSVLLNDLFGEPTTDEYMRGASHVDGAASILTGIAANRSIETGQVVFVDDLLKVPES